MSYSLKRMSDGAGDADQAMTIVMMKQHEQNSNSTRRIEVSSTRVESFIDELYTTK